MMFRVLFAIDAILGAIVVYFFFTGLADGSVSSFNMTLWLGILAGLALILVGGLWLNNNGHTAAANVLLFTLAIPGAFYAIFILSVLILQPNWH